MDADMLVVGAGLAGPEVVAPLGGTARLSGRHPGRALIRRIAGL